MDETGRDIVAAVFGIFGGACLAAGIGLIAGHLAAAEAIGFGVAFILVPFMVGAMYLAARWFLRWTG